MFTIKQSILAYILVFTLCIFFALRVQKLALKKKPYVFIYIILIIAILSLFSGLRGKLTGIDTESYYKIFENIKNKNFSEVYVREKSFIFVSYYLMLIFKKTEYLILFFSFLINTLFIVRFYQLRNISSFVVVMFAYLTSYYFMQFNILRQTIALAILFYATKYLFENRYIIFCTFCVFATIFHLSAILTVLIAVVFYILNNKDKKLKIYSTLAVGTIISAILFIFILVKYKNSLKNAFHFTYGFYSLLELFKFLLFSSMLFVHIIDKKSNIITSYKYLKNSKERREITIKELVFCLSLISSFSTFLLFTFIQYGERATYCFRIFEPILIGILAKNKKYRVQALILSAMFLLIFIINMLRIKEYHLIYSVFWRL